jgi:hypothetical protein
VGGCLISLADHGLGKSVQQLPLNIISAAAIALLETLITSERAQGILPGYPLL